jgi:threonine dehydratase
LLKREDNATCIQLKLRGAYNKMAQSSPAQLKRARTRWQPCAVATGARKSLVAAVMMPTTTPQVKTTRSERWAVKWYC